MKKVTRQVQILCDRCETIITGNYFTLQIIIKDQSIGRPKTDMALDLCASCCDFMHEIIDEVTKN